MNKDKLRILAAKKKVPFGIIEKDYSISIILSFISRAEFKKNLIFKGGTALKKIYFEDYRFSEDLDFTCSENVFAQMLNFLKTNLENKEISEIKFKEIIVKAKNKSIYIKYEIWPGHTNSVRIDLSLREKPIRKTNSMTKNDSYGFEYEIETLSLEEILAEKFRALIERKQTRDLYDAWYLMSKKKVQFNLGDINKKLSIHKDKFDF